MTSIKRLAALVAALGCLAGCGAPVAKEQTSAGNATQTATQSEPQSEALHVVTTIFPLYDWTRQVLGDNPAGITLTMLMDNGVDLHSYQATADDMVTLAGSDLFLYVGGPSDTWVQSALGQVAAPDLQAVKLLDVLGDKVKREQLVEGMQDDPHEHEDELHEGETEHEEDMEHQGEIEHEDEQEIDEHIWMSLRNAALLTAAIADKLGEIDPDNKAMYVDNASRYIEQLDALDRQYAQVVEQAPRDTLVVCDRFPLQYLVDDYDLDYYAAFVGCSAETEASFETVTFLANKVNELKVDRVLTIEGTTHKIAQTVIESAGKRNQEILTFDTLQATTGEQIAAGLTYLSAMENNLEVLRQALA